MHPVVVTLASRACGALAAVALVGALAACPPPADTAPSGRKNPAAAQGEPIAKVGDTTLTVEGIQ